MKVGKPKSKRVPVRLRHKIEKASAAKQRKQRKFAKNNPEWRTRLKKDPGIPNLYPFKEKLLQEIAEKKREKEEAEAQRKGEILAQRKVARSEDIMKEDNALGSEDLLDDEGYSIDEDMNDADDVNPMAALLASAKERAEQYHGIGNGERMTEDGEDEEWGGIEDDVASRTTERKDTSRKAFDKIFKEVVEAADVILYVLDARDPDGTRSREVERSIMTADGGKKRLILILNKIDLIPPAVLKTWLTHLRRYFPTLPLRASNPAPNARTFDHKKLTVKGTSEALFKALKSYAQSKQLKRSISVGVIGYPNVGKSSVINALTSRLGGRTSVCPVGAEAGVTTSLREVKLDNKLKLLDCPGIVFPGALDISKLSKEEEKARLILLNAVPPKDMDDPLPAVKLLLKRLSSSPNLLNKLYDSYELPALMTLDGDTMTDFLVQIARKRGRLGRGGVPNIQSAAQAVITDWRDGRIQGWMDPPNLQSNQNGGLTAPDTDEKIIVKEWAAEFKLEGLWGYDGEEQLLETDIMEE